MRTEQDVVTMMENDFPNAKALLAENAMRTSTYEVYDFFKRHNSLYLKKAEGRFYKFIHELLNMGSAHAPETIKEFFKPENREIPMERVDCACFYILAEGVFDGEKYQVTATSINKYHKEKYKITKIS